MTVVLTVCLAAIPAAAPAQTHVVPSPTPAETRAGLSDEAKRETGKKAFSKAPPAILDAIGVDKSIRLNEAAGKRVQDRFEGAGKVWSLGEDGIKLMRGAKEGGEGIVREGSEVVVDRVVDWGADRIVGKLVEVAVSNGVPAAEAAGALGLSYAAGSIVGTIVRDETAIGRGLGLKGSIGNEVDAAWFKIAPDAFKEAISGTRQVDTDSPTFKAEQQFDYVRLRREQAFNRQLGENQRQRRAQGEQIAAERAALDAEYSSRDRPALDRMGELRQSRGSTNSGFDPAAVTEQLKQISSDLQTRQQQQQMQLQLPPQQQQRQAPAPPGARCARQGVSERLVCN